MSQNFHQNDQIASNPVSPEGKSQMQSVPDPLTQDPLTQDPWDIAFAEAKDAAHRGEVPVGACIVSEGKIVARAGNRIIAGRDPSAHAEMLAIRAAGQALGSERLIGCDLYVTLEPCAMCAGAISLARLRRVFILPGELEQALRLPLLATFWAPAEAPRRRGGNAAAGAYVRTSCLPSGRRRVYGLPRTAHAAAVARSGKYQVG
jgi:pyrimidine deaminase RibD-like protein